MSTSKSNSESIPKPPTIGEALNLVRLVQDDTSRQGFQNWNPPSIADLEGAIEDFEFVKLISRGGMGAVYMAKQISLDRVVAIKLLPEHFSHDELFSSQFQQEARMLAKLKSPGIVEVYTFGLSRSNHLYFVMEFVEGQNLRELIHGSPSGLSREMFKRIVKQLCDALEFAHQNGVLHRDIKPSNVMVSREGGVKLVDFGVALAADCNAGVARRPDLAIGTLDYMSPEQEKGECDFRSDIYSLGVLIYECLCQTPPRGTFEYPGELGETPVYDSLLKSCLNPEPELRFGSVAELREAFARVGEYERSRYECLSNRTIVVWFVIFALLSSVLVIGAVRYSKGEFRSEFDSQESLLTSSPNKPFINSVGMRFVPVPVNKGATRDQKIFFSQWETRRSDMKEFLDEENLKIPPEDGVVDSVPELPVIQVRYQVAKRFAAWLTQKELGLGVLPQEAEYRIPTDYEWSCAAGMGDLEIPRDKPPEFKSRPRPSYPVFLRGGTLAYAGNYCGAECLGDRFSELKPIQNYVDEFPRTAPVGSFPPNQFGLYDMSGNVNEWVNGSIGERLLARGHSWTSGQVRWPLFLSQRFIYSAGTANDWTGFRLVIAVSENPLN